MNESNTELIRESLSGTSNTELYLANARSLGIRAFRGEIASLAISESEGIGSRVIRDHRAGTAYTERIAGPDIAEIISMAGKNASYPEADPGNVLCEHKTAASYDARKMDFSRVAIETKRRFALDLESIALGRDDRIVNVPQAMYGESTGFSTLGNSFGVLTDYAFGYCYAYLYLMANDGEHTEVGGHVQVRNTFDELDTEEIVLRAVEQALARLGATEPDSGEYAIVLERDAASSLLGAFISAGTSPFYGENLQKGRSKLEGKLGKRIGSELFTVIDDPLGGLAPRPFDGEGVPTAVVTLVDRGVFSSEIHNLYSATRGGTSSTGHGSRGGYRGGIATSLHNPYLPNGETDLDGLVRETGTGILISDLEGLHAGLNPISGDFSLSAKGFRIESGIRGDALTNMVVAGNFYELVNTISGVANDRRELTHDAFNAPSIRIDRLSVSGR